MLIIKLKEDQNQLFNKNGKSVSSRGRFSFPTDSIDYEEDGTIFFKNGYYCKSIENCQLKVLDLKTDSCIRIEFKDIASYSSLENYFSRRPHFPNMDFEIKLEDICIVSNHKGEYTIHCYDGTILADSDVTNIESKYFYNENCVLKNFSC